MKKSNLNLSYHEQDGVLLPNICISDQPEDEQPLGRYGRMALAYLHENHPERYAVLKMDGNLMKTMHRVQRDALERMEHLTQQMLLDDPVPETEDLLERARHWNDLKSMAEKNCFADHCISCKIMRTGRGIMPLPVALSCMEAVNARSLPVSRSYTPLGKQF